MKKTLLFCLLCQIGYAQNPQNKNLMSFSVGRTFMGSGDLRGFNLGFGFQKQFVKHFGIETNLRATSATGVTYFFGNTTVNQGFNKELRFNTSGIQLEVLPVLPIINRAFKLSLMAGPILRHQLNAKPNTYGISYNQNTSILSVKYDHDLYTNSLGFSGQVEVAVRLNHKNYLGARLAGHIYDSDLNWYMPVVYQRQF
jgi:opacity protein-like surface antigen